MSKPLSIVFVGMPAEAVTQLGAVLHAGGLSVSLLQVADVPALAKLSLTNVDVLLVDSLRIHPHIVEQIQSLLSAQSLDVPVLVYSSLGDEAAIVAAMQAGAKDFISSKNPHRVLSAVQRELESVAKRAALRKLAVVDHLLQEIEGWMLQGDDLVPLTQKICEAIASTFAVRVAWIGGKQADGSVSVVAASEQPDVLRQLEVRWDDSPRGQGSVGQAIRAQRPVMLRVDTEAINPWRAMADYYGVKSVLALPMLVRAEIIGVLVLYSTQLEDFDEECVQRYGHFANRLALILLMAQEQEQLRLLSVAMSHATQAIFITKADGTIIWFNQALCALSGYSKAQISDSTPHLFSSGGYEKNFWKSMWQEILQGKPWSGEVLNRRCDGSLYQVLQSITPLRNVQGEVQHFLCVQQDVSEKKELERKIEYLAYHDVLTGLPNRALFNDRMRQTVSQARRDKASFALCFVDLDGFKAINDTHGHAAGDALLKQVAIRLRGCVREVDTVARLGGDEFVILLRDANAESALAHIAQKIIEQLAQVFKLDMAEVNISASVGISRYPSDASSADKLMHCADEAMYRAKHGGKNRYVFFRCEAASDEVLDWQI
ncbi:MAG: diguanylate cyclase domain-containing protein [Gallionella sp.]